MSGALATTAVSPEFPRELVDKVRGRVIGDATKDAEAGYVESDPAGLPSGVGQLRRRYRLTVVDSSSVSHVACYGVFLSVF